jgi:hypothetical protein
MAGIAKLFSYPRPAPAAMAGSVDEDKGLGGRPRPGFATPGNPFDHESLSYACRRRVMAVL